MAATAVVLVLCSTGAQADTGAERWKAADEAAVDALLAGKYKKAEKALANLLEEMVMHLGPGVGGKQALGVVVMHHALAEAGLGNRQDAIWDWHTALNLNRTLEDESLSRFGEPGRLLERNPLWKPSDEKQEASQEREAVGPFAAGLELPKTRKRPRPKFPFGARFFGIEGPIVVQVIITPEGEVVRPLVLKDLDAGTITYSALEALRKWKFRPARLDGQPVSVFYNLTVIYTIRR